MSALHPIWTPEDTAELLALAREFPREVGESDVLADILDREGIR